MNNTKLEKVRVLLKEKNLDAILIEKQANFSWLTGGRGFIGLASENSCGAVLVSRDNVYLISNNIENSRLLKEETGNCITPLTFLWYEESKRRELITYAGVRTATDTELAQDLFRLRTVLDYSEISVYKNLGINSAAALESAVRKVKRGMTEFELAADISSKLWKMGIEPITLLIAFDERIQKYRHPLPTENKLENLAMASICARYKGLIISATRIAYIGSELPLELRKKHNAISAIDGILIKSTRPGTSLSDLFTLIRDSYRDSGYDKEENLHHQGGLTGYVAREIRAIPDSSDTVEINQAYAWNPTITGTKSEDTIIIEENENTILSHTGEWQYMNIDGCQRPDILLI